MKLHCKNGCGRTAQRPRAESWKENGMCPKCYLISEDIASFPTELEQLKARIIPVKKNPVDMYFHPQALRCVYLNEYP